MKYSKESLGPFFGILNADVIQEILKYLSPADWPNVQRVNQSFFLLSDKPTVRQRIGANVFSLLIKTYDESFKALTLIDQKELKDFLMNWELSIAQKIIGLFNLIDALVEKDKNLFPIDYFPKSLAILGKFIGNNTDLLYSHQIINTFQPIKKFLDQLNWYLIKAFRISLAPERDWVAEFNSCIQNYPLIAPESLKLYIKAEKAMFHSTEQLTPSTLLRDLTLAQAMQDTNGGFRIFLGPRIRYFWGALFIAMIAAGGYLTATVSPEDNLSSLGIAMLISAGILLVGFGVALSIEHRSRRDQVRESLNSINNDTDVVLQIENQAQAPASENTPLLFKPVNAREADAEHSDLEMQADLKK